MIFPVEDIIPLIPQKPPFVLVDQLLFADEDITRSSFTVKADTIFVKDNHFQEAGLLENIAQTAALRAGYFAHTENKPVKLGYIGAVKDLEIFGLPKVGNELLTEITIIDTIFDVTVIAGKVLHKGQLLAQCEMKVFTVNE
jgi:predicted hotdog family 3-hydroxylacyl-ACP dehydratase